MNTIGITGHKQQIARLGLLLSKDVVPQAILFSGISGIGKKLIALRFLKALFCKKSAPPCQTCVSCIQITKGTYPDVIELHPDEKGLIRIGDPKKKEYGTVRWLIDRLTTRSVSGRYGVLIDGVDRIPGHGQNALLKTIEEPPIDTHIILITSNKSQILPTIVSRCSEISFNPLSGFEIEEILRNFEINDTDIRLISEISGGSVELGLMLSDKDVFHEIINLCGNISNYLREENTLELDLNLIQKKTDVRNLIMILINIYRIILLAVIRGIKPHSFLGEIIINDTQKLKRLIKIFLALAKGLSNNINIRNSLKGMIYSIDKFDEIGIPGLDFSS